MKLQKKSFWEQMKQTNLTENFITNSALLANNNLSMMLIPDNWIRKC